VGKVSPVDEPSRDCGTAVDDPEYEMELILAVRGLFTLLAEEGSGFNE
jgi:hypothetical protein